jgi:ketosteroid isomerase-like protein
MSDSEIIARRRAEFTAAFNREDIETMSDYVTADVVTMAPNQPAYRSKDGAQAFWRDAFAQAETRLRVIYR